MTTDWPRVEYDARATARAADVTGPETEPSVRWEADVEEMDEGMPAVVVADGTVFVASGSVAAALDAADGSERWRTRVSPSRSPGGGPGKPCSATVGDEHLFVGNFDGLFALDREGAVRWSYEVADPASGASGVFRSPAVVDGSVYFTAVGEGAVYAYTTDGERRWRRDLEGDAAPAGPAVADGTVFAGSETGVHALSADGTRRWTAPLGPVETTPTVDDGTVYVTGEDESDTGSFLAAVDADTGDVGWFNSRQNTVTGSPAFRDDGTLGAPTWHGTFFTYDADEGQTLWGDSRRRGQTRRAGDGRRPVLRARPGRPLRRQSGTGRARRRVDRRYRRRGRRGRNYRRRALRCVRVLDRRRDPLLRTRVTETPPSDPIADGTP